MEATNLNSRPEPDEVLTAIADYVDAYEIDSDLALETARLCLVDSLACAFDALDDEECGRVITPFTAGSGLPRGARVPGTALQLDPVAATFSFGTLVRWLDFNDSFYGETVIHPSDNLAPVLMVLDYLSRHTDGAGPGVPTMRRVFEALVKAYEIQGGLALENDFNAMGLDHTVTVKIASAAVTAKLLGSDRDGIVSAVSHAFVDGQALATFRRAPNTVPRKSWAAADAASRAVWLAQLARKGEEGVPSALTAPRWGFCDVFNGGRPLRFQRPFGSYVIENVLFKIGYPAAFHAQSAVEAAIRLHPFVKDRLAEIECVDVRCHKSSMVILNKTGPLHNFADRDHCLQYMMARGLIFGSLSAGDYSDAAAADPLIDPLRERMRLVEDESFSRDYLDPEKRSNANAIQVHFRDGSSTPVSEVQYPLGHPRRRQEGLPLLQEKFERSLRGAFDPQRSARILALTQDMQRLETTPVHEFVDLLVRG
jgi:2-methylcitrate dehydratase